MEDSFFITSKRNDMFSSLRGIDLQDLLVEVENYYLEYRKNLNLPSFVTFGVEIEYEKVFDTGTRNFVKKKVDGWQVKNDSSLGSGGEIVSSIMNDDIKYWQELKLVCDYLVKIKADTLHNAGGHVHIGAPALGSDIESWRQFLKLYIAYENVLFRFGYGDKLSGRKKIYKYAAPVADVFYKNLENINSANKVTNLCDILLNNDRRSAINFKNVRFFNVNSIMGKNTIEFRYPNASTSAIVWQNNINTFSKMILSAKNKVMDEAFLDYKLRCEYVSFAEFKYLYDNVSLKNVLEFVDLVFDNNLDKVYFLRQYLKNFEENNGIEVAVKAKKFVK